MELKAQNKMDEDDNAREEAEIRLVTILNSLNRLQFHYENFMVRKLVYSIAIP